MARRRMIDPNIWESEDYAKLSLMAKLVFVGMISNADDEGRGRAGAVYLRSKVFPYDEAVQSAHVSDALDEIAGSLSVLFYRCAGNDYYQMKHWKKWQRVDKPQPSLIPCFDANSCEIMRSSAEFSKAEDSCAESFRNDSGIVPEQFPPIRKEEQEKSKEKEIRAVSARVIESLNRAAGTQYRTDGKTSVRLIGERLSEGYSQEDLLRVIGCKCAEWKGGEMQNYLRPETLFGEKFESYVNQKPSVSPRAAPGGVKRKPMDLEQDYDMALAERALFGTQARA